MLGKKAIVIIIVIAAFLAVSFVYMSRERISHYIYTSTGDKLAERLPPELKVKYEKELEYTLNKFWNCYKGDLISQNDLTDVMDRMKRLAKKKEIEDMDIFDFIGDVSRIYTDAMQEHHRRELQGR